MALMDTMTNVVGVLIIVLVMIGLGLARSVKKVLSELPLVSEEEHQVLKKEMAAFEKLRDPKEVQEQMKKLEEELQKMQAQLEPMQEKQLRNPVILNDLDALKKKLEEARKERDQRKLFIDTLLAEIDKLKQRLDTTPRYVAPPAVGVRIPSSQPMPDKAEIHRFLLTAGKLMYISPEEFQDKVENELSKGLREITLKQEIPKDPTGKPVMRRGPTGMMVPDKRTICDPAKLGAFFESKRLSNRDMKVVVGQWRDSDRIGMTLVAKPEGGETIEELLKPASRARAQIEKIAKDNRAVFWIHISLDSIPQYLQLRELIDSPKYAHIPVGWELTDQPLFTVLLPHPEFQVPAVPRAPAPPPPPGAPQPIRIAPPKTSVD